MSTLNLKPGYRTAVWRIVKAALEADPVYAEARLERLYFDGDPAGTALTDLDTTREGAILFFPTAGLMRWFDERSASGALVVNVEARLHRLDCEDIFDLQEALESTLNTLDTAAQSLQTELVNAGAVTGLILFQTPLHTVGAKPGTDNLWRLTGQFTIEVLRPLD